MDPEQYITSNDLWDLERLKQHAQHNRVYAIQSPKFPDVAMLHYMDAVQYDNLWNPFNRMCRGLILDMKNQRVLAWPFNKFFNLDQMPETRYENLEALGEFTTSEKLDGSMIIAFKDPNTSLITFTTKGSLDSEHGQYTNLLPVSKQFLTNAERYMSRGTLMFELISKRFQIVVDYKKKGYAEGLYLIGYRDHISGLLAGVDEVDKIAGMLRVPTFKRYVFASLNSLLSTAKDLPVLEEGFVLRFKDDLMVKVKGNAYLAAHRFISHLSDRNILDAVSDGTATSLAQLAPEEYRQDVLDKIDHFNTRVAELENICYTLYGRAPKDVARKDFALWVQQNVPSHFKGFIFKLLDGQAIDRRQMLRTLKEIDSVDGRTRI
jgi:RNA ligase